MAEAAGHKFGQFIGEYCEKGFGKFQVGNRLPTSTVCISIGREADRRGRERNSTWIDSYGFGHDLDYVFERGGGPDKIGTPVAFIGKCVAAIHETFQE